MKTFLLPVLALPVLLLAGCGKKDASPAPADPPKGDLEKMVHTVKTMTQSVSQSVNRASARLDEVMPDVSRSATEIANAAASGDINAMLEQAKKFAGDGRIKEATDLVQKLSSLQLTPEQAKLLEEIKALIQKATSADPAGAAAGALGNVLGGQK